MRPAIDSSAGVRVVALEPDRAVYLDEVPRLTNLLLDAIAGGAAVNFLAGASEDEARAWWEARADQVADGTTTVFLARSEDPHAGADGLLGCTLLVRSRNQNAPHRAEVGKVLVHRTARRQGIGRALMTEVEARALAEGRWLLMLDTETGSAAEALYRALGWQVLGTMPNHSLTTAGVPAPTTFFWKDLRS